MLVKSFNIYLIFQRIIDGLETMLKREMTYTQHFTESSIKICWGMVVQDPPLCFLSPTCGKESKIDVDSFAFYTRSGEAVEFVVWPAMLLCKGGPVLRKGVVQPYKK